jgi:hypothetical protein
VILEKRKAMLLSIHHRLFIRNNQYEVSGKNIQKYIAIKAEINNIQTWPINVKDLLVVFVPVILSVILAIIK